MPACNLETISYGAISLDNVPLKSKVTHQPMYSDDGITVKYHKSTINVEFIYAVPVGALDGNGVNSADDAMDLIKASLGTPGLPLAYSYRGFGKSFSTAGYDIVYGPFPKVIDWVPLGGNKAIKVVWQVEFATKQCPISGLTPSGDTYKTFEVLQLVEDTTLSFDEDGAVIVQTNGTMEVAYSGTLTQQKLKEFIKWYFPNKLTTFNRKWDCTLRKDKRTIDYRITDTEIKSDNVFFPNMVTQNVSHAISSSLMGDVFSGTGFRTWSNDLNGTFTVRPGIWKGWAWIAFTYVLKQRRDRVSSTNVAAAREALDQNDAPTVKDTDAIRVARKEIRPRQIPLFWRLEETIYGRQVSIQSKWVTICSIRDLFASTGLFYAVNNSFVGIPLTEFPNISTDNPNTKADQWALWKTQIALTQTHQGYRNVGLASVDLLFDTCEVTAPTYTDPQAKASTTRLNSFLSQETPSEFDSGWEYQQASEDSMPSGRISYSPGGASSAISEYMQGITAENSWIDYKNNFALEENSNATYIPTLETVASSTLNTSDLAYSHRDQTGFRIHTSTKNDNALYSDEVIQVNGKPIYKVRMKGYAVRVGYQIPCPELRYALQKVGSTPFNMECYRIGKQNFACNLLTVSDEVPVFVAHWNVLYALPFSPEGTNLQYVTSANPAEFA